MKGDPVRSTLAHLRSVISTLIVAFGAIGASPCLAQTRVTSLEELRRELAAGDFITVVPADGQPVAGRLMRFGNVDLDVRLVNTRAPQERGPRDVAIPLDAIQSLERSRDSARNGAAIGAGIGAGFGGAMFVRAVVIDRNEMDEWATLYVGAAAVCTGIGALIGWAMDAAHSKPPIRFDASSGRTTKVSVQPVYSRGRGIALAVSFSR
jgi:HAMP domain-containing protein